MTGAESVEWYEIHHTHGFHGFHVFDDIPFASFQTLLWAVLPSAAFTDTCIELVWCFKHTVWRNKTQMTQEGARDQDNQKRKALPGPDHPRPAPAGFHTFCRYSPEVACNRLHEESATFLMLNADVSYHFYPICVPVMIFICTFPWNNLI